MKILYVFFHSYSDMPYHTREWVEAAIELGHEVKVLTSIDPAFLDSIGWAGKVDVIQVDYPGNGTLNYFKLCRNFKKTLSETFKFEKPELIYERFSYISTITAAIAAEFAIPYSTEINGIIEKELELSGASRLRRLFFSRIQKRTYSSCNSIIAVTPQIKKWIEDKFNVRNSKILVVSNGVNVKRFHERPMDQARKELAISNEKFVIGFLGSLFPWNGLPLLVEAAGEIIGKYPDCLFLIGGGQEPMKSQLEKMVEKKGLEKYFKFAGQIPWKTAPDFISTFDLGIEPKEIKNNTSFSPLKLFSYLACARPVLASDIHGIKEFFAEHNVGLTFKNGDSTDLANKICEFRNFSKEQIDTIRINSRKCVEEHYSWKKIVDKTLNGINKLSTKEFA